jgi:hypothetical protein
MKTSELTGAALDWAVTKCEGYDSSVGEGEVWGMWGWATCWGQGGAIIQREGISVLMVGWDSVDAGLPVWEATSYSSREVLLGNTPLIAAMRCYVASVMGDEIDVPEELKETA